MDDFRARLHLASALAVVLELAGCIAVVAGIYLVSLPAALIVAGLLALFAAQGIDGKAEEAPQE